MKAILSYLLIGFGLIVYGQSSLSDQMNKSAAFSQQIIKEDSPKVTFSILQNPSDEFLTISLDQVDYKNTSVYVYNVIGKLVYKQNLTQLSTSIPVDLWKNGVYLVMINTPEGEKAKRFVKN